MNFKDILLKKVSTIFGINEFLGLRCDELLLPRMIFSDADIYEINNMAQSIKNTKDWTSKWSDAAQRSEERAKACEEKGYFITAEEYYRKASMYYRFAEYLEQNEDEKIALCKKWVECFEQAGNYIEPALHIIRLPYSDYELKLIVRIPASVNKVPCIVTIGGIDGVKEENYRTTSDYLKRGWATVNVDLPGQGELRRVFQKTFDVESEKVIRRIIDYISTMDSIDCHNIILVGYSFGGLLTLKTAACDKRLKACVSVSAPYELVSAYKRARDPIPGHMEYSMGTKKGKDTIDKLVHFNLYNILPEIKCPTLIVHGGADEVVPIEKAHRIFDELMCEKKLLVYPNGNHMCLNNMFEWFPDSKNWIEDQVRRK